MSPPAIQPVEAKKKSARLGDLLARRLGNDHKQHHHIDLFPGGGNPSMHINPFHIIQANQPVSSALQSPHGHLAVSRPCARRIKGELVSGARGGGKGKRGGFECKQVDGGKCGVGFWRKFLVIKGGMGTVVIMET